MRLKDISFRKGQVNLLYDDFLLSTAEQTGGPDILRFWESPRPFIVLGRTSSLIEDVKLDQSGQDRIPVLRRSSGGGTVIQGPGCLNYVLVLSKSAHPELNDLHRSYNNILGRISRALSLTGLQVVFRPISDLVVMPDEKKVSGNAQHRSRHYILHHGTLLYDFDLALLERYLRMPCAMPVYRRFRPHGEFVTNIPLTAEQIKQSIRREFRLAHCQPDDVTPDEQERFRQWQERSAITVAV